MAELSGARRMALAAVVESCPDAALPQLAGAAASMPGERAALLVDMVAREMRDRARRASAFAPLMPMFRPRLDDVPALAFPRPVLPRLWKAASSREPALLARLDEETPDQTVVADRICAAAAAAVRDHADGVWPPALSPEVRDAGLAELAACFDLAHLARRDLKTLDAWVARPNADQVAELRLLLRDAAEVAPDGAVRMMEILFAHIDDAVLVARLTAQASNASGRGGFLRESELSVFIDRLVQGLEARAGRIAAFKPSSAPNGVAAFLADVSWCASAVVEMDLTIRPSSESSWGLATRAARMRIGGQLTSLIRSSRKAVANALPMTRMALTGRMTRMAPRLDVAADGDAACTARLLATLVGGLRGSAAVFGCESDRTRMADYLSEYIFDHADQGLELINAGLAVDEAQALTLLELDADLLGLINAGDAARTIRRRMSVAGEAVQSGAESRTAA